MSIRSLTAEWLAHPLRVHVGHLFLLPIVVFIYLKLHLSIPGLGVPYFFAHLTAGLYLASTGIPKRLALCFVLAATFLVFLYAFTSEKWYLPTKSDAQYLVYWLMNFITVFAFLRMLKRCEKSHVHRFSRIFLYAMILIGVAEVYFDAKPMVDAVRSIYTSETSFYDAESRDLSQYGAIRPTVFTSEPSSVGNFFGFLMILFLATSQRRIRNSLEAGMLLGIAIFVFRTPTLIAYPAILGALWLATSGRKLLSIGGTFSALGLLALATTAPYIVFTFGASMQNEVLSTFISTGSYFIRQIAPINTFLSMLSESPIIGYGFEYSNKAMQLNSSILMADYGGFYTSSRVADMLPGQFSTNAFWEFLSINGCVGSLLLLTLYNVAFRSFGVHKPLILLLLSSCALTIHAGLLLPFTWTPVIAIGYYLSQPDLWPRKLP